MYDIVDYVGMIAFEERTSAYARALQANIRPGTVVLDIGTGFGILSFLACRAGAAKVYAVEPADIIQLARETAADNGFSDRIEFIQALTTQINLPEKVDGIVADVHGVLPLYSTSIISILDARDRFLKPEGWIIPARETIWAALSCCPTLHSNFTDAWDTEYQFDFQKARWQAANSFRGARLKPEDLIVEPRRLAILDYREIDNLNVSGDVSWVIDYSGKAHGICVWFDSETSPGFGFSNSPAVRAAYVFRHAFFPWPEAVDLIKGDQVKLSLRADFVDPDYVWYWETCVTTDSGRVKDQYRQSTFNSAPLSPPRLHKRAASFVPDPNEDWRIDYKVLDLMGRNLSLDEIAKMLLSDFPRKFKDWKAALTRVANLSERYSK